MHQPIGSHFCYDWQISFLFLYRHFCKNFWVVHINPWLKKKTTKRQFFSRLNFKSSNCKNVKTEQNCASLLPKVQGSIVQTASLECWYINPCWYSMAWMNTDNFGSYYRIRSTHPTPPPRSFSPQSLRSVVKSSPHQHKRPLFGVALCRETHTLRNATHNKKTK